MKKFLAILLTITSPAWIFPVAIFMFIYVFFKDIYNDIYDYLNDL